MCETCGCGQPDEFTIRVPGQNENNEHFHPDKQGGHYHTHSHDHEHEHDHYYEHDHQGDRVIEINKEILAENNLVAERNRGFFEGRGVLCLNLVSSPGSGKTTILEKTIRERNEGYPVSVIEGDQQSMNDAERINKTGVPVIQVNTGTGCHLDSKMVSKALKQLEVGNHGVLFIENVGNLVCPALFDLGETKRVVVMSVTEGDDKPEKYPYMFISCQLCLINKSDLLPYVDFDVDKFISVVKKINPTLEFILISAKTGEGFEKWFDWLDKNRKCHVT
ncbi:MAG: hydrogenase nickel incorporation protein HypB [Bacteroidetes bacterium]|nr:hydrogenase nickel incorporation protein HypB [Bacteroidota bacterium]